MRHQPLMVYESTETVFSNNGMRLLSPTVARYTLEFGTAGSLYVEHPIDDDGDWKTLVPGNIIRAPIPFRGGIRWQPFRIYRCSKKRSESGPVVKADAQHIFYDLNYVVIDDVRPTNLSCQAAIQWLFDRPYDPNHEAATKLPLHNFTFSSDIADTSSAEYQWKTMTGALIGEDNCVLKRWGGELFVNGLYFSINSVMEDSMQDAFHIAYRCNLQEVEETLDYTNTFSQLVATDNFGHTARGSVSLEYSGLPFEKTLHAAFSYSDDTGDTEARFQADFAEYLSRIQEVEASYYVQFKDLPVGSEFHCLASYEVGDTGIIEDVELGIRTTQRIVKTVTDLLTGERISTETGNVKRSIARYVPFSNTVTTGESALQKQINAVSEQASEIDFAVTVPTPIATKSGKYLTAKNGKYLIYKKE